MKKSIFIIAGISIILILLAVWAYLFLNGKPQNTSGTFAELGAEGDTVDNNIPLVTDTSINDDFLNVGRSNLYQLNLKPTAGYIEINPSTSTPPVVLYVEQGTGHIYSIDTESGQESRISSITTPAANKAVFSNDGNLVAIQSLNNNSNKPVNLLAYSTTAQSYAEVENFEAVDFSITNSGSLVYSEATFRGIDLVSYNPTTKSTGLVISLPFTEATIIWGSEASGPHFVYPKASYLLDGYLYEIMNGKLNRLPVSGYGLTATVSGDYILFNSGTNLRVNSYFYDRTTKETTKLQAPVLTEKCAPLSSPDFQFVCGFDIRVGRQSEMPDLWYQGINSYADTLYELSATSLTSNFLSDTLEESGREIDIVGIGVGDSGAIYFINKNDNTLWAYEK
jgi:hypothetical protein